MATDVTIAGSTLHRPEGPIVQLSAAPSGVADARDLADAVTRAARALGHRPALTYLPQAGRQEQSYASVAQWVAKIAHLVEVDLDPDGPAIGIVGRPGWVPAVAALGAWWAGRAVVLGGAVADAGLVVASVGSDVPPDVAVQWWGEVADGSADGLPSLAHEAQPFPDAPPAPRARPGAVALITADGTRTQADLLAACAGASGVRGVDAHATDWLVAAAVRPLVAGKPTVLLGPGTTRDAAAGDRVTSWG